MFNIRWSAKRVRTRKESAAHARRPASIQLESLEDRFLLATRTWSGGGANNNWNTPANWTEGQVPAAGDDLLFPTGADRPANVNNLAAGITIQSTTFTGGGYTITGNALDIGANGITHNVPGPSEASNRLDLPLTFAATRTITVNTTGTLIFGGVLSGAGGLTKTGEGVLQLTGTAANTYTGETTVNAGTLELNKTASTVAVPGALTVGDGTGTGSDLVRLLASSQIAPATVATILSTGTLNLGTFAQTLAGLTLTGGTVSATTGTLTLTGNVTTNTAANAATINGNLALGAAARTFTVAEGGATDDLVIAAVISGSGALTKVGTGRLVFSGVNTYTGSTTVQAGTLNLRNAAALGATSAGTTVANQAVLELQGGIAVGPEALTFSVGVGSPPGTLRNASDNNSWAGSVDVAADAAVFDVSAGQLTLSGVLSGGAATQTLTKRGTGTLILTGTGANTFAGTTTVAEGVLQLNKTAAVNALAGNLVVGDGTGDASSDVVRLIAPNQIADGATVTVAASGLLDINGQNETVGPLTLTGGSITTGAGALNLTGNVTTNAAAAAATISGNLVLGGATRTFTVADGAAVEDLVLSAVVSGAAGTGLTKEGPGTLRLGGANTYTGATTVNAGTLLVNGTQSGSSATVATGATLGGSGTVGALTANGTVAPGSAGPGILRSGNVTFNSSATFRAEINGTTAGTGHDQLNVTGTVNLGNATLNASLGFTSVGGTPYVLIANDSDDPVTGTFNGLAEGANLTIGSRPFRISYRGGDGNDVVLTDISTPTTTTLTADVNPAVFGQQVAFTAVVAPSTGSGTPTGTVTFRDGSTVLGTGTLANGRTTFVTADLTVASRQITAVYAGDNTFAGSTSAALAHTVNKAATSTVVTGPSQVNPGQTVTLQVTVRATAPGVGVPTGTVTIRDGTTVLGISILAAGVATFSTSTLSVGPHSITATYSGESNFEVSTSPVFNLQVASPLPPNQRLVNQLYLDLLQRPAEPGGLSAWSGQLDRGVSRADVARAITTSLEYRTLVVTGLYRKYLRREPDPEGRAAYVRILGAGGTVEQAAASMVSSTEYFSRQAANSNDTWLTAIYRDVLNRVSDPGGRAAHLSLLNAGVSRGRIAEGFFTSEEARRLDVRGYYQRFLRREPDLGGLNGFVGLLARGLRQEQVIAAIAGSQEYAGRV